MRTLSKEHGSVNWDSGIGDGDKWVDLKDRVYNLGIYIREMNRRQIHVLWDPKLIKLRSSSRNVWQSPRHCIQTQ